MHMDLNNEGNCMLAQQGRLLSRSRLQRCICRLHVCFMLGFDLHDDLRQIQALTYVEQSNIAA